MEVLLINFNLQHHFYYCHIWRLMKIQLAVAELTRGNTCVMYIALCIFISGCIQETIIFFKSVFCNTDFISAI